VDRRGQGSGLAEQALRGAHLPNHFRWRDIGKRKRAGRRAPAVEIVWG
jgi:hypothetical protein